MKNGIYALAALDGRPLDRRDLVAMALAREHPGTATSTGCRLLAQDERASAVHVRSGANGIDTLLGDLDEPADAARLLGLAAATDPLTIVLAMVDRFGDRAPMHLLGAWLLVRWDARRATMTLLMAERVRDACYVATDGRSVALSPELARLARLAWVDAAPDPTNLLLGVGRARLRRAMGNRTILRDVVRVMPGTLVTIGAGGVSTSTPEPRPTSSIATGVRFEEAVERIDLILRRAMSQIFAREGDAALSLSGGLDSAILALYAARERGDRRLTLLTSAAPSGSGLADESGLAAIVATHLGVPIEKVAPPAGAAVYRPSDRAFAMVEQPLVSPRHYIDEALEHAALDNGASVLIDGMGGEVSVTNHGTAVTLTGWLRDVARDVRNRRRLGTAVRTAADCLHVQASASALDRLSIDLVDVWKHQPGPPREPRHGDPLVIDPSWAMAFDLPSCSPVPALRHCSPFQDERLVRYAATLPATITRRNGLGRALGRRLLRGALPDSIALQPKGLAYSPSYNVMLREQAPAARARLHDLTVGDAGDWVDLQWIDRMLLRVQEAELDVSTAARLQLSLILGEFIMWWGDQIKEISPP